MPLHTLEIPKKLAKMPTNDPLHAVNLTLSDGSEIKVGDPKYTRGLLALMNTQAVLGGAACHWGGPAALIESMSALHGYMFDYAKKQSKEWFDCFHFANDVGHAENGLYALRSNLGFDDLNLEKIKQFRSIDSKLTGHGEAHLNPEGVYLSNGPLGSSIGQTQGLAIADSLKKIERTTFCVISDGACMEGEAKEALAAIPGLAKKGKLAPYILMVSDNNTKLGGRIDADSFSMQPSFESLKQLGWSVIEITNGHDMPTILKAIELTHQKVLADPTKPVCLWLKTIKGKGLKATEESASGGHGHPLKNGDDTNSALVEIFDGSPVPSELKDWADEIQKTCENKSKSNVDTIVKEKIQIGIANALEQAVAEGLPVFSVSADLQGSTGLKNFHNNHPERFIEVGVAESNMVSVAAGLAKEGFVAFVDTFAQFGVTKGNLPLTMASLSQAPIIAVFSHIGFQDAADGASHQATTYLAAVSSIPNVKVINVGSSEEAENLLIQAIRKQSNDRKSGLDGESYVFFLGRENFPRKYIEGGEYPFEKAYMVYETDDADLILAASGTTISIALEAKKLLNENGITCQIVANPFVNSPDVDLYKQVFEKSEARIISIEEHQTIGGMGSMLCHALKRADLNFQMRSIGINGEFGRSAYKASQLYDHFGINAEEVLKAYKDMV